MTERSDAGLLIVQEVFGFVKDSIRSAAKAGGPSHDRKQPTGEGMYGGRIDPARHGARRASPGQGEIYAKIGIDLKWSRLSECVGEPNPAPYMRAPRAAADLSPKAPATAYPFSRSPQRITVYRDRV